MTKLFCTEMLGKVSDEAIQICEEDINSCKKIGEYGYKVIKNKYTLLNERVRDKIISLDKKIIIIF